MKLTKNIFRFLAFSPILLTSISFFASQPVFSQHGTPDTSCQIKLASINNKEKQFRVKESNVVFPDILKGNEAATMGYIENFSSRRKAYLVRMYKKGKILLPKTAKILKKYNLPEELKILLPLESAYNPTAISKAGAVGYWQIMDEVAREYGMKYSRQEISGAKKITASKRRNAKQAKVKAKPKDERMNFDKSTVIAARYLHARRRNLNDDWLLVVASYNCGVGNVWSAMKRTGKSNPDFWDVKKYLPEETKAYVMNFITLNVIFSNYDNFIKNKLIFKPVKMEFTNSADKNILDATVTADLK